MTHPQENLKQSITREGIINDTAVTETSQCRSLRPCPLPFPRRHKLASAENTSLADKMPTETTTIQSYSQHGRINSIRKASSALDDALTIAADRAQLARSGEPLNKRLNSV